MKIELHEIPIRDVVEGYVDNDEEGVFGYGGRLNIRPQYQREFVYEEKLRNAVIDTIMKGFPLNVMYWMKNEDGTFELLDGQQRTVSFCQYVNNDFSIKSRMFGNLTQAERERILDYKLFIYFCEGTDEERLGWFRTINTGGKKLKQQEMRNAVYIGPWLTSAKRYFSKRGCAAAKVSEKYCKRNVIEQELLETVLNWISARDGMSIEDYMSRHQHDRNADDLWIYFNNVIGWAKVKFKVVRSCMEEVEWGFLYNEFHSAPLDADVLEEEISRLMLDSEVKSKKGMYQYVLTRDPKSLSLRAFPDDIKMQKYEMQKGICPHCLREGRPNAHYAYKEMEADHITPWIEGGQTTIENCQMLCKEHNRRKSDN